MAEQTGAIGTQAAITSGDLVGPVGVEERGSGGAIGQREASVGNPVASFQPLIEPGVDLIEQLAGLHYAIAVAIRDRAQRIQHHFLHRRHHIVVEDAIQHMHLQTRIARRDQADGARVVCLQMGDYGAALEDAATVIQQHREALEWPEGGKFGVGRRLFQIPVLERGGILVEGDQHLLAVGRERMGIEFHRDVPGTRMDDSPSLDPFSTSDAALIPCWLLDDKCAFMTTITPVWLSFR